jgi:hypothetical protein
MASIQAWIPTVAGQTPQIVQHPHQRRAPAESWQDPVWEIPAVDVVQIDYLSLSGKGVSEKLALPGLNQILQPGGCLEAIHEAEAGLL